MQHAKIEHNSHEYRRCVAIVKWYCQKNYHSSQCHGDCDASAGTMVAKPTNSEK